MREMTKRNTSGATEQFQMVGFEALWGRLRMSYHIISTLSQVMFVLHEGKDQEGLAFSYVEKWSVLM
jgi:hypothetical protein